MPNKKEQKEIIRRFNILKGQIEGISKMITNDKDCLLIIHQLKAIKNGFNRLSEDFIKEYLNECVRDAKKGKGMEKDFEKALHLFSKY